MIFTKDSHIRINSMQVELLHKCYIASVDSNGRKFHQIRNYPEARFMSEMLIVWPPVAQKEET